MGEAGWVQLGEILSLCLQRSFRELEEAVEENEQLKACCSLQFGFAVIHSLVLAPVYANLNRQMSNGTFKRLPAGSDVHAISRSSLVVVVV